MNMAGQHKRLSPLDMLLSCVTVSCLLFGSSTSLTYENKCIGSTLEFSVLFSPPGFKGNMYFTPSGLGSKKIIMDKGRAMDPRLDLSYRSAELRDLTKRDEGTFSISYFDNADDNEVLDVVRLNMLVCTEKVTVMYGATYNDDIPSETAFLEFTPLHSKDQPKVIWSLTELPTFNRGRVQLNRNTWEINDLTQKDNGNYSFRAKDSTLLKRIQLEVKEYVSDYNAKAKEDIFIENFFGRSPWSVTFTRKGEDKEFPISLIHRGKLVRYRHSFEGRIWLENDGIQIEDLESRDSGTFEFRDQQGNLAQIVELDVEDLKNEEVPIEVIIGIIAGIVFAVIICCCCVRKCCCKKSSSKRDVSTLPVYYHDSTQPAAPSSSAAPAPHHSYQPVNSHVPKEPTASSFRPSVNNPVNIHVNPPQPEVSPLRGQRTDPAPSLGSDCLSTDPGPQFEPKGLTFPSAPPLNSDPTFSDVYASDKLNFL